MAPALGVVVRDSKPVGPVAPVTPVRVEIVEVVDASSVLAKDGVLEAWSAGGGRIRFVLGYT